VPPPAALPEVPSEPAVPAPPPAVAPAAGAPALIEPAVVAPEPPPIPAVVGELSASAPQFASTSGAVPSIKTPKNRENFIGISRWWGRRRGRQLSQAQECRNRS